MTSPALVRGAGKVERRCRLIVPGILGSAL